MKDVRAVYGYLRELNKYDNGKGCPVYNMIKELSDTIAFFPELMKFYVANESILERFNELHYEMYCFLNEFPDEILNNREVLIDQIRSTDDNPAIELFEYYDLYEEIIKEYLTLRRDIIYNTLHYFELLCDKVKST